MLTLKIYSKNRNVGWELEEREIFFLYSYLLRFSKKNNIDFFCDEVLFENHNLIILQNLFQEILLDLLSDIYVRPNEKEISKHPTRYERFIFKNNKYVVNYTNSITGRLIYLIYLRYSFISDEINENEGCIILKFTKDSKYYW
jgi:hypothetical protein